MSYRHEIEGGYFYWRIVYIIIIILAAAFHFLFAVQYMYNTSVVCT